MAFLEDPRLRQRWNQISQTTETVTENAAAGIWSFGHTYVTPCFESLVSSLEGCTTLCLGDREERARRARDRERARAAYSFDFYDDWDDDLGGEDHGGILGGWRGEDWDRLLAGTGKGRRGGAGEVLEQPRSRKRGMSYGTRGVRKKSGDEEDPTIIPSTTPIGFLGKLPFKIGGTLRYKPSAANLQEHPGASRHTFAGEREPLLGADEDDYHIVESPTGTRKRSGTAGSGDTSDSFRSRGDLFPSDGEGDEDAIPLDDEFAVALDRMDDQSSSRTKSSKGKRNASYTMTRSASRTTLGSIRSRHSVLPGRSPAASMPQTPELASAPSMEDLRHEEEQIRRQEDEEVERKRQAAAQLATERGLHLENAQVEPKPEVKAAEMVQVDEVTVSEQGQAEVANRTVGDRATAGSPPPGPNMTDGQTPAPPDTSSDGSGGGFVPARLPYFR